MEHIYFWKLILWGMAPEQTNAQTNCTLCPNIDLTALKHVRQNPTPRATFMHYYPIVSFATYPCTLCTNHTEVRER